jgi:hypothetical protein
LWTVCRAVQLLSCSSRKLLQHTEIADCVLLVGAKCGGFTLLIGCRDKYTSLEITPIVSSHDGYAAMQQLKQQCKQQTHTYMYTTVP